MRRTITVCLISLAAGACSGKKSESAGAGTGSTVAVAPVDAAVVKSALVDAMTAPKVTKAMRADYQRQLALGRKAAKAAKWPEAIAALDAALVAIPGNDVALSELSFAAMSAGDAVTARRAGRQAVLVATEPKIKAAALYNLGRVEETDRPALAIALYDQSLALRPSAIVDKRRADLATRVSYTPPPLPCSTPMPAAALCSCVNKTTELEVAAQACTLTETDLADFQYARYATSSVGEEEVLLVGKSDAGWSVVARVDGIYNPGAFGIYEDWSWTSADEERFGTRSIARFVTDKSRSDSDPGVNESESESTTQLIVCVRDNAGGPPTCPIAVPTAYRYDRDVLIDDAEDGTIEHTAGLPIVRETKVSVTIGADGIAKVRAVAGRPDAALLGDKKVWQ